jgi:[ribosomal protein S18]-alanine N-acetyltransferase
MIAPCDSADALAALHRRAFADAWSADALSALMQSPGALCLADVEGGAVRGFVLARAAAGEGEILTIAVDPPARRNGLGAALVRAAVERLGVERLFLEVAEDNAAARGLYGGLGFTEVGRRKAYYAREGASVDALVLALNTRA